MSNNEEGEEETDEDEDDNMDMSNSSYNKKMSSYLYNTNRTFSSSPTTTNRTARLMSKGKTCPQSTSISLNLSSADEEVDKSEHVDDHYLPQQQQRHHQQQRQQSSTSLSSSSSSPFPIHDWWRQNYLLSSQQQQLHWQRLSKGVGDESLTSHVLSKPQLKVIQESSQFLH